MELVTGRAGSPHITSQQDRQKHQGIWGTGAYILKTGNNLEPVVQSSNSIQIKDGALMSQGALFSVKVGTVDEVTIANGSQGMMRKDVIVARYTYNQGANAENAEWAVVQGTPAASNPQIPQITEGDIQAGDATVDTSVFIVTLDGINITSVDVVPELAPDIAELKALLDELNGKSAASYEEQGPLSTDVQNNSSKVIASMNINEDGVYVINGSCYLNSTSNTGLTYLQVVANRGSDNAAVALLDYSTLRGDQPRLAGTTFLNLQAGDVVQLSLFQNGGYGEQVNTIYMRKSKL